MDILEVLAALVALAFMVIGLAMEAHEKFGYRSGLIDRGGMRRTA